MDGKRMAALTRVDQILLQSCATKGPSKRFLGGVAVMDSGLALHKNTKYITKLHQPATAERI